MPNNIKVAVKIRPLINREIKAKMEEQWKKNGNSIQPLNALHYNSYYFGKIQKQLQMNFLHQRNIS